MITRSMISVTNATTREVSFDNETASWDDLTVTYAPLSVLLVHLQYLYRLHQHHHWVSRNDPYYGDHLMFQRLYEEVVNEIDNVAEKAVGLGGSGNVNLQLQLNQLSKLSSSTSGVSTLPMQSDLAHVSLDAELEFVKCVETCKNRLKERDELTYGLDNMLAGIADHHEHSCYLLKQRCL